MRLLLVSHAHNNPNAGASRVYHLLSEGLSARGHTVRCLHHQDIDIPKILPRVADKLIFPQLASRTARRFLNEQFDVIFTSSGMLYPLFKQLHAQKDRPLLVNHLHGLAYFDRDAIFSEVDRGHMTVSWRYRRVSSHLPVYWDAQGSKYADLSIVQNRRDADYLDEHGASSIEMVALPVHSQILAAGASAPLQDQRNPMSLLWFGSWVERKGMYYMPRAFEQIVKCYPEARLTIGGTGLPAAAILADFPSSIHANITVLPRVSVEEHIALMRDHAIFLFPSISEGFGLAVIEALSMRMAVVTTQTGIGGDMLRDYKNARIIPASSARHIADATIELIANTELRRNMGDTAVQFAQQFRVSEFAAQYEAILSRYAADKEFRT